MKVVASEKLTLEQFAERHGLELVARERAKHFCPDDAGRWYCSFENVETKDGRILVGELGNGPTPEAAAWDYAKRLEGKQLVVDAMKETRRTIWVENDFIQST